LTPGSTQGGSGLKKKRPSHREEKKRRQLPRPRFVKRGGSCADRPGEKKIAGLFPFRWERGESAFLRPRKGGKRLLPPLHEGRGEMSSSSSKKRDPYVRKNVLFLAAGGREGRVMKSHFAALVNRSAVGGGEITPEKSRLTHRAVGEGWSARHGKRRGPGFTSTSQKREIDTCRYGSRKKRSLKGRGTGARSRRKSPP